MTKQETIQKAYGDYFEQMNPWIDENGWFNKNAFYQKDFSFKYEEIDILFSHFDDFMIPTSIVGIKDNNGWTKIESEGDLPKEKGLKCEFLNKNKMTATYVSDDCIFDKDWFLRRYTHWRPKEILKMPIY